MCTYYVYVYLHICIKVSLDPKSLLVKGPSRIAMVSIIYVYIYIYIICIGKLV